MNERREYKGQMQSDGTRDELLPLKPTVQCVSCQNDYDRADTSKYRQLGVFANYCLCEACLYKDQHGWG